MRPQPTPEQLAHCLSQLSRPIPTPPPKRARAQASKWGLKVGDKLINTDTVPFPEVGVTHVDSLGITVKGDEQGTESLRWDTDPRTFGWTRQPKRRRKKVAAGEQPSLPLAGDG